MCLSLKRLSFRFLPRFLAKRSQIQNSASNDQSLTSGENSLFLGHPFALVQLWVVFDLVVHFSPFSAFGRFRCHTGRT